jgi:hypothetical protein
MREGERVGSQAMCTEQTKAQAAAGGGRLRRTEGKYGGEDHRGRRMRCLGVRKARWYQFNSIILSLCTLSFFSFFSVTRACKG